MIDLVIPFYNDSDEKWRNVLKEYMTKEGSNDRQVVGEERYRDWETFKYWFRCVENNCPWVNKVFLIVASESQIPDWLDTTNPKLRIIYHRDYIPEELLPTFNTLTIELFVCRIKDLSDNYIYCNDDYFFLNPVSASMFFIDDIPVYRDTKSKFEKFGAYWTESSDGTFYKILNNTMDFQYRISGDKANCYSIDHLPVPHKKDFELEITNKYLNEFIEANSKSRFRSPEMYSTHLFTSIYRDLKPYYKFDYEDSYYLTVKKDTNFYDHEKCKMICFNDTEQLSNEDFNEVKNRMLEFFEDKFPNKSLFEK